MRFQRLCFVLFLTADLGSIFAGQKSFPRHVRGVTRVSNWPRGDTAACLDEHETVPIPLAPRCAHTASPLRLLHGGAVAVSFQGARRGSAAIPADRTPGT